MISVLFFGPVADRMQTRATQLAFTPGMKLQDVISLVSESNPHVLDIVCVTAVNQMQIKDPQLALSDGDEIAFMAKFSGG